MSVIIKGMEMPTSCSVCDIKVRCFEDVKNIEWLTYHPAFYEERLTNCPLVEAPKWVSVTERLPEVGKKVLVFAYGNDTLTARMQKRTENGYPVFECNGIFLEMAKLGRITHWMPIPQPPESEGE